MDSASLHLNQQALALVQDDACCMEMSYRRHHALLLEGHCAPEAAIGELLLFRLWMIQHVRSDPVAPALPAQQRSIALAAAAHARYLIARDEGVDVELALGMALPLLVDTRFALYERFHAFGRQPADPHGLRALSLALACQLFDDPGARARTQVRWLVEKQFRQLAQDQDPPR